MGRMEWGGWGTVRYGTEGYGYMYEYGQGGVEWGESGQAEQGREGKGRAGQGRKGQGGVG